MRNTLVYVGIMAVMGFTGVSWTSGGQSPRSLTLHEMCELRAGYNDRRCLNVDVCVNCVPAGACFTASDQAACEAMVITACAGGASPQKLFSRDKLQLHNSHHKHRDGLHYTFRMPVDAANASDDDGVLRPESRFTLHAIVSGLQHVTESIRVP